MKKLSFFLAALTLLLPVIAFADSVDDDDTPNPSSDDCENFCYLFDLCNAGCIDGNCLYYCRSNEEDINFDCLDFYDCEASKECICSAIDNETSDDDNDNNDDSGGCTVSPHRTGQALTAVMLAIGLLALWLSARTNRAKNN
ncbi:MAG TPA: hypothetical protein PKW95_05260 [bacterium]|nr:hypothetical protein [bacterium]